MNQPEFSATGMVTLTTDFGVSDPYVGVMKAVLLGRNPVAQIIDLSHFIPAFQPAIAGFWLARCWRYFPAGTVHLAVVDPGVGTERGMVVLILAGQVFVAPDNGLLEPLLDSGEDAVWREFRAADLPASNLPKASATFHGRDIFAPLVADISANRLLPYQLGRGREIPPRIPRSPNQGRIVAVDHYGNLITDIGVECLNKLQRPALRFRDQQIRIVETYGSGAPGQVIALANSWGVMEIAQVQGNAAAYLQAVVGESVSVAGQ